MEFVMRVDIVVSTVEQNLKARLGAVERVFEDKASAKTQIESNYEMISFVRGVTKSLFIA